MTTRDDLQRTLADPQIRAFLQALRLGEGTRGADGYRTLYGGGTFDSFARHPHKPVKAAGITSTAAGAYQFLAATWDEIAAQYGLPDFNPTSQDLGAVALLYRRHAVDAILAGRIEEAVELCAKEWASLPGSPYGQPTVTMDRFLAEYGTALVALTSVPDPMPTPAPIAESLPTYTVNPMPEPAQSPTPAQQTVANAVTAAVSLANPVAGVLLQIARAVVPELAKLYTPGTSEVAQRNVKAAEAVIGAVMTATGSATPAQAIDKLQTDPTVAGAVKEAAVTTLQGFGVLDVSGVPDARQFMLQTAANPNALMSPQFLLSMYALTIVAAIVVVVLLNPSETWLGGETRSALLFGVLTPLLGALAFWFGTNSRDGRKDELIAGR